METLESFGQKKRKPENVVLYGNDDVTQNKKNKRKAKKKKTGGGGGKSGKDTEQLQEGKEKDDDDNGWKTAVKFDLSCLKSEKFEEYYQIQLASYFSSSTDFELFVDKLREKLPCVFRINKAHLFYSQFYDLLTNEQFTSDLVGNLDNGIKITPKALTNLPEWGNLVFNINIPRMEFKKSDILANFHKFIQKSVDSGLISRQEAVSMIPPMLMQAKKGDKIFDMCAAPGSKTAQFLEVFYHNFDFVSADSILNDTGFVLANDNNWNRAYMMIHQLKRLNTAGMVVISHDAQFFPTLYSNDSDERILFDKILADVPCSSDAVMRKLPQKWKKWGTRDSYSLHKLQLQILKRGVSLLKVGGTIIYSTCSLNPIENEAVVCEIMRQHGEMLEIMDMRYAFEGSDIIPHPGLLNWKVLIEDKCDKSKLVEIKNHTDEPMYEAYKDIIEFSCFPPDLETAQKFNLQNCIRLFPHHGDTSGFFITVIKKINPLTYASDKPNKNKPINSDKPFTFIADTNPEICKSLVEYYGLNKNFPFNQLATSSNTTKKISFISKGVHDLLVNDKRNQLKLINVGVKLFKKNKKLSNDYVSCNYRICQDGIMYALPYLRKNVFFATFKTLKKLLTEPDVLHSELEDDELKENLDKLKAGCVVVIHVKQKPSGVMSNFLENESENEEYLKYLKENFLDVVCCYNSPKRISSMINKEHQHVFNLKYNLDFIRKQK